MIIKNIYIYNVIINFLIILMNLTTPNLRKPYTLSNNY